METFLFVKLAPLKWYPSFLGGFFINLKSGENQENGMSGIFMVAS
jgi:hypothetical protein